MCGGGARSICGKLIGSIRYGMAIFWKRSHLVSGSCDGWLMKCNNYPTSSCISERGYFWYGGVFV